MISKLHASPIAGHYGFHKTYEWIKNSLLWEGMKKDIHTFVVECGLCQRHKGETMKTPSALQPLPIPLVVCANISMGFIVGLPKYEKK
jgi:hypothetical protein